MNASIYGIIAEYEDSDALIDAAKRARAEGYRQMDAYSPLPVHGLPEVMGFEDSRVPWTIFISGVVGGIAGFLLQCWVSAIYYPLNVGGRPFISWPSFIPVTFECTVLFAAFGAVIGMLAMNGLPRPHHPIFNAKRFELASQTRFFLCIEAADPRFDREATRRFLEETDAHIVSEVAN